MKRILSMMLIVLLVSWTCLLTGCSEERKTTMVTIVYETYYEPTDTYFLMVLVPCDTNANMQIIDLDGAILPEARGVEASSGIERDIRVGDVLVMHFDSTFYIREETVLKMFTDGPSQVTIAHSDVLVEKTGLTFSLSIPLNIVEGEGLNSDSLYFFTNGADYNSKEKAAYSTVIDDFSHEKLLMTIPSRYMLTVINCLGLGSVSF